MTGCIMVPIWSIYAILVLMFFNSPSVFFGAFLAIAGALAAVFHWILHNVEKDAEIEAAAKKEAEAAEIARVRQQIEDAETLRQFDLEIEQLTDKINVGRASDTRKRNMLPASRPLGTKNRGYNNKIAGLWYRRNVIEQLFTNTEPQSDGSYRLESVAVLTRDPYNEHDESAIRVHVKRKHVGYVTAKKAAQIAKDLDDFEEYGYRLEVDVVLEWDGEHNGEYAGRIRIPDTSKLLPGEDS